MEAQSISLYRGLASSRNGICIIEAHDSTHFRSLAKLSPPSGCRCESGWDAPNLPSQTQCGIILSLMCTMKVIKHATCISHGALQASKPPIHRQLHLHIRVSAGQYQIPSINTADTRFQDGGIEYWNRYRSIPYTTAHGLEVFCNFLQHLSHLNVKLETNLEEKKEHVSSTPWACWCKNKLLCICWGLSELIWKRVMLCVAGGWLRYDENTTAQKLGVLEMWWYGFTKHGFYAAYMFYVLFQCYDCAGDARTQSPPTKNCAPESPTFGEIASFNSAKCKAWVSTWRNRLLDHGIPCAR